MTTKTQTGDILIPAKQVAVPGETIAAGAFSAGRGTRKEGDKIIASLLGMVSVDENFVRLIPLSGKYIPKLNDKVVGKVVDVLLTGWRLEINSPYTAVLPLKEGTAEFVARGADLTQFFKLGDYVLTKITNVTSQKLVDVTTRGPGLRKLHQGRLIEVNPHKVPRIIGKEGSMVALVKNATGCAISVGQNGWVWISGEAEKEHIAVKAIKLIETEAHKDGLTERVREFLEKETGQKVEPITRPVQ